MRIAARKVVHSRKSDSVGTKHFCGAGIGLGYAIAKKFMEHEKKFLEFTDCSSLFEESGEPVGIPAP
jgi:hypothetical protein